MAYAETAQYSRAYQFGSALLKQCFVLLPVLGVAPFFIGKLLDLPGSNLPESRAFPPEWLRAAAFAGLIGLLTIASFAIDTFGWPRIGGWLRVVALSFYVGSRMPFRGRTFLANCLRVGIVTILAGFAVIAAWPIYRIAGQHIVFITGFNFIAFTVAIRVVFGHSGNSHLFKKRLPFFIVVGVLIFLAMVSRYVADTAPVVA